MEAVAIMAREKQHKKWQNMVTGLTLSLVLIIICGCSSKPPRVYKVAYTAPRGANDFYLSQQQKPADGHHWTNGNVDNVGRSLVKTSTQSIQASNEYHLGPGDEIRVKIWQLLDMDRETSETTKINEQGQIYLPVLNHIQAAGLTTSQLRKEISKRLGQEYLRDPQVEVKVTNYRSKEVVVLGSVGSVGSVYLEKDNATLLDVIGMAGGVRNNAAPNIEILRGAGKADPATWDSTNGKYYFHRDIVPVAKLFAEDGSQVNPLVYPGDVIKISSATEGFIYLSGEVNQPGAKPFNRPLTILQAISSGGGISKIGREQECKVIRRLSNGSEQTIVVDIAKVRSGEHRNILMAQNDLVVVPIDPDEKFWHDLASLFNAGVRTGVDASYNAATGEPTGIGR